VRTIKIFTSQLIMYLVLIFVVIVSAFPIVWVIMSSFKTNAQILSNPFSLPTKIIFNGYAQAWKMCNFSIITVNSFIVSMTSMIASLVIFAMAAYVIAKYNFKGKNILYLLFVLTLLVPAQAKAQPILDLIIKMHLYDTKTALVLVYISMGMAVSLFILKSTFTVIPIEFSEAAWLEGAGFIRTFFEINLPLAKTGLVTAGTLMFLSNWNEYFYAMLLTMSVKTRTLPYELSFFNETFNYNYTSMFAALVIAILPGIIVYAIFQEQITNSIVSSGVKG